MAELLLFQVFTAGKNIVDMVERSKDCADEVAELAIRWAERPHSVGMWCGTPLDEEQGQRETLTEIPMVFVGMPVA